MNAVKSFGSTKALDDASFELREGEWLALLGPNGAGKTTIVRSIAGRVRLDSGKIVLLGAQLNRHPRRHAPQAGNRPTGDCPVSAPDGSGNLRCFGELVGLKGAARGKSRVGSRFYALSDRANDPIQTFSGGMKRRLNLVCAVLHRPPILLLDEPTVGVDPQSRQRIWEMLESLRRDGASLLLTRTSSTRRSRSATGSSSSIAARSSRTERWTSSFGKPSVPGVRSRSHSARRDSPIGREGHRRRPFKMLSEAKSSGHTLPTCISSRRLCRPFSIHLTGRELRDDFDNHENQPAQHEADKVALRLTLFCDHLLFDLAMILAHRTGLPETPGSKWQSPISTIPTSAEGSSRRCKSKKRWRSRRVPTGSLYTSRSTTGNLLLPLSFRADSRQRRVSSDLRCVESDRPERRQRLASSFSDDDGGSRHSAVADIPGACPVHRCPPGETPTQQHSMVAYYAAGIGVMFLLFSMAGAGGALIEEQESGTLERCWNECNDVPAPRR